MFLVQSSLVDNSNNGNNINNSIESSASVESKGKLESTKSSNCIKLTATVVLVVLSCFGLANAKSFVAKCEKNNKLDVRYSGSNCDVEKKIGIDI